MGGGDSGPEIHFSHLSRVLGANVDFCTLLKICFDPFVDCDGYLNPYKLVEAPFNANEGGCFSLGPPQIRRLRSWVVITC